MKIIIAHSTATDHASYSSCRDALCAVLEGAGHRTQLLELPSIAAPRRALSNIASYRLLRVAEMADAIICLDAVSAVLRHQRKYIVLLDDAYLAADRVQLVHERSSDRSYLANVLQAALGEADTVFTLSRFASETLRALPIKCAEVLNPSFLPPKYHYDRTPGPELLVLGNLNDRQRPELLISCLDNLPEPFRARWIAPYAPFAILARLRNLAHNAGIGHRLTFDLRPIDSGEKAFLLSRAAALVDLAPNQLAIGDSVYQALASGVSVIACTDGGALTEVCDQILARTAHPTGNALAKAVRDAYAPRANASPLQARLPTPIDIGWLPLLKVLSR